MCIYFYFLYFYRRGRYRLDRNRDKGIFDDDNWFFVRRESEDEYENLVSCFVWMIVAFVDVYLFLCLYDVMFMKCV